MMETVTYQGLTFEPYIRRDAIEREIKRVADELSRDYAGQNPLFVCVLTGAFVFAADLYRLCDLPKSEIAFIRFKSYEGTHSTGVIKEAMGLTEDIEGRPVIIIEDIVDTGLTAKQLRETIWAHNPSSVKMVSLLFKPEALTVGERPEYVCFEIPRRFILGYGLDIDGFARNLPEIYVLKEDK